MSLNVLLCAKSGRSSHAIDMQSSYCIVVENAMFSSEIKIQP